MPSIQRTTGKVAKDSKPDPAVAAYAQALYESTGVAVDEGWVVQLAKESPGYAVHTVDLNAAYSAFRAALYLFYARRQEA